MPLYKVDGTSTHQGKNTDVNYPNGFSYATWRVVRSDNDALVCAFFGGCSFMAASEFCERINNDPAWNTADHQPENQ